MTVSLIGGSGDRLTLRYIPVLTWAFIILTLYGIGAIIAAVAAGSRAMDGGTAFGVLALVGMALLAAATAGRLVVCRFDRAADRLEIIRYGLLGRAVQARALSEVVGLEVRLLRRAQHRIELRLSSGERLPLTPYYIVDIGGKRIKRLAALIGVEPVLVPREGSPPR
jgi:ABC-type anion transport system duplicated permease subunit